MHDSVGRGVENEVEESAVVSLVPRVAVVCVSYGLLWHLPMHNAPVPFKQGLQAWKEC